MIEITSKFNKQKNFFLRKKKIFLFLSTRMDFDQTQSSSLNNNPVATYSDPQHRASLPVTINLNPNHNSQSGNPGSLSIPLG